MAKQFRFPDVGEGITEGEIVRWLVKEGDEVKVDQPLAEIETDKAIAEMPSPYAGTVLKLHFKEKDVIKVGEVLITIGQKGEKPAKAAPPSQKAAGEAVPAPAAPAGAPAAAAKAEPTETLATPRIRKLALELDVDIKRVRGTGPLGRVTEEDVRGAAEKAAPAPEAPAPAKPAAEAPPVETAEAKPKEKFVAYGEIERIPLRGVRRATAKRMAEAVSKAAQVTHFDEADAATLIKLRDLTQSEAEGKGIKLTFLPFIIKALIAALKLHPFLNAELDDEAQEIVLKKYYNIGIAVDVPDGLIVPVVKNADQKTIFELAEEIKKLAEAAKARKLDIADLKGGTFSITNVGVIGGEAATPIVNYPEVAILGTLKIADRVRAVNGKAAVRKTLPLCLTFDHRVLDGAEAARFVNVVKKFIEDGSLLESVLAPTP